MHSPTHVLLIPCNDSLTQFEQCVTYATSHHLPNSCLKFKHSIHNYILNNGNFKFPYDGLSNIDHSVQFETIEIEILNYIKLIVIE